MRKQEKDAEILSKTAFLPLRKESMSAVNS